jgi:hypothetical protein
MCKIVSESADSAKKAAQSSQKHKLGEKKFEFAILENLIILSKEFIFDFVMIKNF